MINKSTVISVVLMLLSFGAGYGLRAILCNARMTAHLSASDQPLAILIERIAEDMESGDEELAKKRMTMLDQKMDKYVSNQFEAKYSPEQFFKDVLSVTDNSIDKSNQENDDRD